MGRPSGDSTGLFLFSIDPSHCEIQIQNVEILRLRDSRSTFNSTKISKEILKLGDGNRKTKNKMRNDPKSQVQWGCSMYILPLPSCLLLLEKAELAEAEIRNLKERSRSLEKNSRREGEDVSLETRSTWIGLLLLLGILGNGGIGLGDWKEGLWVWHRRWTEGQEAEKESERSTTNRYM